MNKVAQFYTRVLLIIAFCIAPFVYLYFFKKKKNISEKNKILIIPQLTRIGDLVSSTPVFREIKVKYPNSYIAVLVSASASEVIKNNPRIDEIIIFEDYKNNFSFLIKKIRDSKFDWGISLSGTALSSLLFFFGLIPNRMKITRSNRPPAEIFTDWLCNVKEKYERLSYLPAFYLKMLNNIGVHSSNVQKEVFINKSTKEKIDILFKNKSITSADKLVGISITAGNKIKEWGDEKFIPVAKKIAEEYNAKIVFIGGERDEERVSNLIKELGDSNRYVSAVGITLEDLPLLMKRFTVFISVDTGPVHIAEALSVPLVDILGPVNDIELTPRGKNVQIVKPSSDIQPTVFAFREAGDLVMMKKALESITPNDVLNAFYEIEKKLVK